MVVIANPLHFVLELFDLLHDPDSIPAGFLLDRRHVSPSNAIPKIRQYVFQSFSNCVKLVCDNVIKLFFPFLIRIKACIVWSLLHRSCEQKQTQIIPYNQLVHLGVHCFLLLEIFKHVRHV